VNERKNRGKVMVVDDDRVALEVARERLEGAGFEVITRDVAIGTSASIVTERPDIVLLDVNMPGIRGNLIAKLVTAREHKASIILHTASDADDLRGMASECGAVGIIEKTASDRGFIAQFESYARRGRP
jgi:DNA-binding response OmpR family regulator